MSLINFPILYIPDPVKDRPLFNGQIYVGKPDLDPTVVINQKQLNVIEENGTVVPVAQPFTLSAGGVPVYNGNPVRLDVTGNYSIKILSKLGAQVYYIANVFEGEPVTDASLPDLLINDLSQAYEFDTALLMTNSAIVFPIKKVIHIVENNTTWDVFAIATKSVSTDVINNNAANRQYIRREESKKALGDVDLSSLIDNQRSIVVAGDSLSFNAYDWPIPTNALNYAYINNSPGLMAWSHMLRDFCHRSDINFIHADNVPFRLEGSPVVTVNDSTPTDRYFLPFNNRSVRMVGKNKTDVVQFVVPCNKVRSVVRIHCVSTPTSATADAGKVDVSFKTYPYTAASAFKITINTGGRTDYFELDPFRADFGDTFTGTYPVLVEFSNWRTNADLDPPAQGIQLAVSAFSEKLFDFRITGHGGYTIAQVEAEKATMITNFAPEVLFLICGANDRALGVTSAAFIADLTLVVNATRAANSTSEIIFMSTTKASDSMFQSGVVLNGETIEEWLRATKQAAINLGCRYFDTYNLFEQQDTAEWRFDNVHMTKFGNKFLFDNMVKRFFPSAIAHNRIELTNPQLDGQYAEGRTDKLGTQNVIAGSSLVKFDLTSLSYLLQSNVDAQAVIKSVTRVDAFTVKVETNYPLLRTLSNSSGEGAPLINIALTKTGQPISTVVNIYTKITGTYSVEFFLLDMGVTPPTTLTDIKNDTQEYIVSWS